MIRALALDPGTSCTGYAVMSLNDPRTRDEFVDNPNGQIELIDFGTIKPKRSLDYLHKCIEIGHQVSRIVGSMVTGCPLFILIEEFEGAVRRGRSANAMKVWGAATACAVGAASVHPFDDQIIGVPVKDWNAGHVSPTNYPHIASLKYGQTITSEDAAAAVLIGDWWLSVKRIELLAEVGG